MITKRSLIIVFIMDVGILLWSGWLTLSLPERSGLSSPGVLIWSRIWGVIMPGCLLLALEAGILSPRASSELKAIFYLMAEGCDSERRRAPFCHPGHYTRLPWRISDEAKCWYRYDPNTWASVPSPPGNLRNIRWYGVWCDNDCNSPDIAATCGSTNGSSCIPSVNRGLDVDHRS